MSPRQPSMAQRAVACLLDPEQALVPDHVAWAVAALIEDHPLGTAKADRAVATIVDAYHEATFAAPREGEPPAPM